MAPSHQRTEKSQLSVVIIGAGMSGILMGIRLKGSGYENFTILEKGHDVGGTWRDNQYPGLHCDVPSHHYCYSFELNSEWSHTFASGPEIRAYLQAAAAKYNILPHVRFNTEGKEARWNGRQWEVTLAGGEQLMADVLVSATGVLRVPVCPDIPGLDSFAGEKFHTARWNHAVDLADKRIGVVGTGSTAVQLVCALSGKVRKLTLFQRTAQWVVNAANPEIPEETRAEYRRHPEKLMDIYREMEQFIYRQTGGAIMGRDPVARAELEQNVEANLASVRDPELRRKLTPDHKVGCKRLIISPSFYEAVQDESVELVTEPIDHCTPDGMVTTDGALHRLDVLVLATGFDPNAFIRPMAIIGDKGRTLDDVWAERPTAYRSMAVPDMPNFFMIEGPFSPVGNLSLILVSEWQVDYIMKCIALIEKRGIAMAPDPVVTDRIMSEYREAAKKTIWATGGCRSWYQDKDGVPIIYPYAPDEFRDEICNDPQLDDFRIWPLPDPAVRHDDSAYQLEDER